MPGGRLIKALLMLPNDQSFGMAATLEFSLTFSCLTLSHLVLESIFPWFTWDFSFYLDGRFHWNGMRNVHGGFCH
jgi:hypothetical protein